MYDHFCELRERMLGVCGVSKVDELRSDGSDEG